MSNYTTDITDYIKITKFVGITIFINDRCNTNYNDLYIKYKNNSHYSPTKFISIPITNI